MKRTEKITKLQTRVEMDLRIDDSNLSRELKEQASKYSYWAAAYAIKLQEYMHAKFELAQEEAKLGKEINEKLLQMKKVDPSTRASDKVVKDRVYLHPAYEEKYSRMLELGMEEGVLAGAKEAFRQRSQLILEMARQERQELSTPEAVFTRKLIDEYKKEDEV